MTADQQAGSRGGRRRGSPGAVSRWWQQQMNARMNRNIRGGRGRFLGMDVLVLHTVGRRSSQPRQAPVTWFADVPVTPQRLDGADRAPAWQRITAVQPRYAKYQRNTDREYPVIRLTLR
jgi:F420H(2)-dependent quinone reductase